VAKARRNAGTWKDDGVRLFGVGITRAQHHLYLIADLDVMKTAAHGPLAALTEAIRRKRVRVWSAAALLGMEEPRPQFVDGVFTEVSEMLRQWVTVTDISDEKTFYAEFERRLSEAARQVWMWSPWISKRAKQVVPLISDTVARGVDVRVFIRPDEDRNMAKNWAQRELPALRNSGATIIRSDHEHRKIVVIDERIVLFGSLNALSNSQTSNTRESMLTLEGGKFAHRLLDELQARDLGTVHPCAQCRKPCEVRRATGRSTEWSWHCVPCRKKYAPIPKLSRRP
jgi:phosphatidylserine/phosphatidylglycerophosphate/cardiolipin synthase-like enzyme